MKSTMLAVICVVAWTAAAALSGTFGIWVAVGSVAVILGVLIAARDLSGVRSALRPTMSLVAIGLAVGGAMSAATYVLYPMVLSAVPSIASDTASLYASFRAPAAVVTWIAFVPVVIGEELVWRGVVQGAIADRLRFADRSWPGMLVGVVAIAVVYALAHAPIGSPVLVLVAFGCGLVWSALRAVTGSVAPALVAHLLWDVLILMWLPLG
ncbi:MAG: CPBP family intramembrane metalloprotease [Acidobacteria bacterium]|nr:CPBP family intramembrane metalloprotease [Acidobacteriota bacterium]